MKKIWLILASVLVVVLIGAVWLMLRPGSSLGESVAGIFGDPDSTLVVWVPEKDEDIVDELAEMFEDNNSEISVSVDTYKELPDDALIAEKNVDILFLSPEDSGRPVSGLRDLSALAGELDTIVPMTEECYTLPVCGRSPVMVYRSEALDEGVIPSGWIMSFADIERICLVLESSVEVPCAISHGSDGNWLAADLAECELAAGNHAWGSLEDSGRNYVGWVSLRHLAVDMNRYFAPREESPESLEEGLEELADGKIGMLVGSSTDLEVLSDAEGVDYSMIHGDGVSKYYSFLETMTVCVVDNSHASMSVEFVSALFSIEAQEMINDKTEMLPFVRGAEVRDIQKRAYETLCGCSTTALSVFRERSGEDRENCIGQVGSMFEGKEPDWEILDASYDMK